ncbi:hypothetical protein U8C32_28995 (plasmid) [Sinorhizobium medicae]|uniref:hypothetical protein n=1 Tax=Sinorhizobium TaxID=28105 RepID=UPI0013E399AD|nr:MULTISPECIES: hypothetical protein [Sinorhizobium]MBO1965589.1 hypothetical protein [Sinorhizobium medicae]WQO48862.1 hypothetical protein U8C42_30685 [Sinorhizobium medicae]WQO54917.1 hypothetical protein U8C36_21500 [Sinorhizobium medicae]WQO70491.1 hypothetical protein U8C40_38520 [Sinorhizobium medicae]WQO76064.1 hypothetical protein U8C31_29990 [Sinorhizobium medicae]
MAIRRGVNLGFLVVESARMLDQIGDAVRIRGEERRGKDEMTFLEVVAKVRGRLFRRDAIGVLRIVGVGFSRNH